MKGLVSSLLLLSVPAGVAAQPAPNRVVRSEADLPVKTYQLEGAPSAVFMGAAFERDILPRIKRDAEALLAGATIESGTIRSRLQIGLASIALLQGNAATAQRWIEAERAAQTKPQLKAIGYLNREAAAAALTAPDGGACRAAADRISARLRAADPAIVREEAILRFGQTLTISEPYLASAVVTDIDPKARAQGGIDLMDAMLLATWRADIRTVPPCRDAMAEAWRAWIADPAHEPADIWPGRQPEAARLAGARPVVVAVWDTGIDTTLFPGQMALDPAEPLDGQDNDGNGIVDDVHGPTYDLFARPAAPVVTPPSAELRSQLAFQTALLKGQLDLNYGLDTLDARLMALRAREASVADQALDIDLGNELFDRSHGTAVASQLADGAPFVRLYLAKDVVGGYNPRRIARGEAEADRWLATLPALFKRMHGAGVRIVNMSWVVQADMIAQDLLSTGQETDPERAQARARAIYTKIKAALHAAMSAAPDMLFVVAAGNNNQSDATYAGVPQSFDLPNMIVVGAVSKAGTPAAFTTFGQGVRLYAPGDATPVRMAGGGSLLVSGTSLAAPYVARIAATMLAVNPALVPAQLVEGLVVTGTSGTGDVRLAHPAAAVEWARARR